MSAVPRNAGLTKPRKGSRIAKRFLGPREGDIVTPNVNKATMDPFDILDVPLVFNPDGSVTAVMTVLTGQTKIRNGWACVLPWRADDMSIAKRAPAAWGLRGTVSTPPASASGIFAWTAIVLDVGAVSGTVVGMDWDGADPRARCGQTGSFGVGAEDATGVGYSGGASTVSGLIGTLVQSRTVSCSMVDAAGDQVSLAGKTSGMQPTGQTWFAFGAMGHIPTGPQTITFWPNGFIRQLPPGGRY